MDNFFTPFNSNALPSVAQSFVAAEDRQRKAMIEQEHANRANQLIDMQIQKYVADQAEQQRQQGLQQQLFANIRNIPRQQEQINVVPSGITMPDLQQSIQGQVNPYAQLNPQSPVAQEEFNRAVHPYLAGPPQSTIQMVNRPAQDVYNEQIQAALQAVAGGTKISPELDNLLKMAAPKQAITTGTTPSGFEYIIGPDGKPNFSPQERINKSSIQHVPRGDKVDIYRDGVYVETKDVSAKPDTVFKVENPTDKSNPVVLREAVKDLPKLRREATSAVSNYNRFGTMLDLLDGSAGGLKGNTLAQVSKVFDIPATSDAALYQGLAKMGAGALRHQVVGSGQVSNCIASTDKLL
jgi:hypothetical protein